MMRMARMSTAASGLILALALSFNGDVAEALECYVCNSRQNASCALSPPAATYIKNCEQEHNVKDVPYTVCRLMIIERNGETVVDRRCGWIPQRINRDSCMSEPRIDVKAVNCECHSELCNAAPATAVNLLTLSACSVALLAFMFPRM